MNRKKIEIADYAGTIIKALKKGIWLTTKAGDKVNSMVIGWGTIGDNWVKPVFVAYVRNSRYTREMLDANPEFTVNVPINGYEKEAFRICGSLSGRDMDKIEASGLTLVPGEKVSVPAIKEYPLTLECKVIYRQAQDPALYPEDVTKMLYPVEENGEQDYHYTYFGEIVSAYILEE